MPGKFEGEPKSTEYFYDLIMQGHSEPYTTKNRTYDLFEVFSEEAERFKDEEDFLSGDTLVLWEDDLGFVYKLAFATREQAIEWIEVVIEQTEI